MTRKMTSCGVDNTVIVNGELPKSWKCPHCGKVNRLTKSDNTVFMQYMKFIRHCEYCSYLHFWELRLTDDFMKAVVQMLVDEDSRKDERNS